MRPQRWLFAAELVNRAGEQQLREFCEKDAANAELVDWLMGDLSALRHYILGGKVHTNRQNAAALPADYIQSLGILRDLRKAYGGDLTGADADVFLRMMIGRLARRFGSRAPVDGATRVLYPIRSCATT